MKNYFFKPTKKSGVQLYQDARLKVNNKNTSAFKASAAACCCLQASLGGNRSPGPAKHMAQGNGAPGGRDAINETGG